MTSNSPYRFGIADHIVEISFAQSEANSIDLLPSLTPFRINDNDGEAVTRLYVDDKLSPAKEKEKIGTFDTGNGDIVVFQLPDGGYQYIIRNIYNDDCCLLITDCNFSHCTCALNGDSTMRGFGLNNALMMCFAFATNRYKTILIHASCVGYNNRAYPFIAKRGTGKSTHSQLWLKNIPDTELINDDNPILRIVDNTVFLYGSPWSGKTPCYRNMKRQLGAIVEIARAKSNSIERLSAINALAKMLPACSTMKWDETIYGNLCDTLTEIIEKIPIYTLHCLPDDEAALLCQKTIAP